MTLAGISKAFLYNNIVFRLYRDGCIERFVLLHTVFGRFGSCFPIVVSFSPKTDFPGDIPFPTPKIVPHPNCASTVNSCWYNTDVVPFL